MVSRDGGSRDLQPLAYSVKDACALLGISRSHFYKLRKKDALRAPKAGGRTIVPASEVRRLAGADASPEVPAPERPEFGWIRLTVQALQELGRAGLERSGTEGDFLAVLRQSIWTHDPTRPLPRCERQEHLSPVKRELFEAFASLRLPGESDSNAVFRLASLRTIVRV